MASRGCAQDKTGQTLAFALSKVLASEGNKPEGTFALKTGKKCTLKGSHLGEVILDLFLPALGLWHGDIPRGLSASLPSCSGKTPVIRSWGDLQVTAEPRSSWGPPS